jgi:hypothetical protein
MAGNQAISSDSLNLIQSKAASDPAFRAKLLTSPNEALALLGIRVPAGVTVRFVENTAATWNFVLPARAGGELSDEDLEKAAGGIHSMDAQLGGGIQSAGKQLGGDIHAMDQQLGGGIHSADKQLGSGPLQNK